MNTLMILLTAIVVFFCLIFVHTPSCRTETYLLQWYCGKRCRFRSVCVWSLLCQVLLSSV